MIATPAAQGSPPMSVRRSPPPLPAPFALFAGIALLALDGCVVPRPYAGTAIDRADVAVLGVAVAEGVRDLDRSAVELDLLERLEEQGRRRVVSPRRVRDTLGGERLEGLLDRYARHGAFDARERRLLADARLGARLALVVRIGSDTVRKLEPRHEGVSDASGRRLPDRSRVHLATRREARLSAEFVDLASGQSLGRRDYVAAAVARVPYTRYRGSSFGGSVAAVVANTLLNGAGQPRHPPAPALIPLLRALLAQVVRAPPAS